MNLDTDMDHLYTRTYHNACKCMFQRLKNPFGLQNATINMYALHKTVFVIQIVHDFKQQKKEGETQ